MTSPLSAQRKLDLALFKTLLEQPVVDDDYEGGGMAHAITESEREAFSSMLERLERGDPFLLSPKQRAWAKGVKERATEEPEYLNLASSGKLCRGREVPTPEVLKNLPTKPPVRRRDDD